MTDLEAIHAGHDVRGMDITARRPVVGRLVTMLRAVVLRPIESLTDRQTAYNAANARLASELWNASVNHAVTLEQLRDNLESLQSATRVQAEGIRALGRTTRVLERELQRARPSSGRLDLDYFSLTQRFRGSEEQIREHLGRYVGYFAGQSNVVDVGCGRGEFLELLRSAGIQALGVDVDPAMVEHCRAKGLSVERRDALVYLESVREGSLGGVFAAQVVEHLEPHTLIRFFSLSRRALRPGGVLVLETVNPECLLVFATFYIDFTHVRPYNAEALEWLAAAQGFEGVQVDYSLPVDPAQAIPTVPETGGDSAAARAFNNAAGRLNERLYGFQAYAVIGKKPGTSPPITAAQR